MIHPSVPAIMVTPICPHSLSFRPIVVPAGVELKVTYFILVLPRMVRFFFRFQYRRKVATLHGSRSMDGVDKNCYMGTGRF